MSAPSIRQFNVIDAVGRIGFLSMDKPSPFHVSSWERAEENAARWIRYWGYPDARVTDSGPDGGIDVAGTGVFAQVKFKAHQAGIAEIQRLAGIGRAHPSAELMFFAGTSFSAQAVLFAESVEMALFTYELDGSMHAVNEAAELVTYGVLPPESEWASTSAGSAPSQDWNVDLVEAYLSEREVPPWLRAILRFTGWSLAAAFFAVVGIAALLPVIGGTEDTPGLAQLVFNPQPDGPDAHRLIVVILVFGLIVSAAFTAAYKFFKRGVRELKLRK